MKSNFIIAGSKGKPMACTLYESKNTEAPLVVYAHGINGFKDWGGMPQIAKLFTDNGLHFLSFNFSHNGTTPESPQEFLDLEAYGNDSYLKRQYDLTQVLSYAQRELTEKLRINDYYLIGHSRGGVDALLFASKHTVIKKLVTWAAPEQATTPWGNWNAEKLNEWKLKGVTHLKNGRTQQEMPINYSLFKEYKANKHDGLNTEKAARDLQKPWLIVHGEEDEAVFVKAAYSFKEWQPNATVKVLPGTGHTFGRKHPEHNEQKLPEASRQLADTSIKFLLA